MSARTRDGERDLEERIGRSASRHAASRRQGRRTAWFGLGMFGLVGWSVAVPTIAGTALGAWIDARSQSAKSWTLMLLLGGLMLGCVNAWSWIRKESEAE